MVGLDTNILLRFLLKDDPQQASYAGRVIKTICTEIEPGYINLVSVAEIAWVMLRVYRVPPIEVADAIEALLKADTLLVQNQNEVFNAVATFRAGRASFPDALISALNHSAGCKTTLIFDIKATRFQGFTRV